MPSPFTGREGAVSLAFETLFALARELACAELERRYWRPLATWEPPQRGIRLLNLGLDYPSDKTLRPSAIFPSTYKIEPLSKFKKIKITSFGTNYFVPPQLVVIDGFTGRVNTEARLRYDIGDTEVTVIRNTTGLYNVTPKILPVNNPNGIRISNITFDSITNDVTVAFAVTFANASDFPFNVGDNVIIENTNIDLNIGGKGYNSSSYGYSLFKVKQSDPNIGGEFPSIVYNISDVLKVGESPGVYDEFESFGTATPESYFPIFDITLEKGSFNENELVIYEDNVGVVERYGTRAGSGSIFSGFGLHRVSSFGHRAQRA